MLASDTSTLQQAKLVLLGDMGAGKSSLVLRFVKGQFFDYQVHPQSDLCQNSCAVPRRERRQHATIVQCLEHASECRSPPSVLPS